MKKKKCSKCGIVKTVLEFHVNRTKKDKMHHCCKKCQLMYLKSHYEKNKDYYLKKSAKRNIAVKRVVYNFLVEYCRLHPCKCGESDFTVLDFNHKNRGWKRYNISTMMQRGMKLSLIKRELKKCEVMCSNCHRRHTAKQMNWYTALIVP